MSAPRAPEGAVRRRGSGAVAALVLGFALALVVAGAASYVRASGEEPVAQPVAFNHRAHVEGQELECSTCHPFFRRETRSGMPDAGTCALCHMEPQGESAEEARLVALLQAGEPLVWGRLFRQPPHVFYSHRRHVVVAGLECETCHGDIGHSEAPPAVASPMAMETCLDCHARQGASGDCTACHR